MSIIVAIVIPNNGFLIYGDRKRLNMKTRIRIEDIRKVYNITNTTAIGLTGHSEWCISVKDYLISLGNIKPSEMISIIKEFSLKKLAADSTITLGGIYDDGKLFTFTYKTTPPTAEFFQSEKNAQLSVASNPQIFVDQFSAFFKNELMVGIEANQAIINTIKFASEISPETISSEFDFIGIPYEPQEVAS